MTQCIYLNVSRRNDDLPEMIEGYSEKFNLSKADTVAEILRAYPKLIAYKQKVMEEESKSFGRMFSNAVWEEQNLLPRWGVVWERAKRRVSEYIEQRILFLIWSREHPPLRVLFFYALSNKQTRHIQLRNFNPPPRAWNRLTYLGSLSHIEFSKSPSTFPPTQEKVNQEKIKSIVTI